MRIEDGFQQTPLSLPPAWDDDLALRGVLQRLLPDKVYSEIDQELKGFQDRLAGPIHQMALLAEGNEAEPTLVQYDHWGRRVDMLKTSEGWRRLKGVAAAEGLVADPIEQTYGEYSRLWAFTKGYLMVPEGRYVGCPISMTDGCATVLHLVGTPKMKAEILPKLISRDPNIAWTAGQWMTERPGGSDVSLTETVARPVDPTGVPKPGDAFIIDGFKWFSSATDGNVALALARTSGKGSRGLSLFLVELRDKDGKTNGVYVHRLKKKWGTKALPTAELTLSGAVGHLIGDLGKGVSIITTVLNITRLHCAISGLGALRRSLVIAKSFARVRHVGGENGSLLIDNAMHTSTLLNVELTHRALLSMVMGIILLMGRSEALDPKQLSESEKWRLRLLTPVAKSFSADLSTGEMINCMEALGGQGYMVENEIGRLLQDACVERIWEGTTNTLALDVVRVILKSQGAAIQHFIDWVSQILKSIPDGLAITNGSRDILHSSLKLLAAVSKQYQSSLGTTDPRLARQILYLIGYTASATYLLEQSIWSFETRKESREVDAFAVEKWLRRPGLADAIFNIDRLVKGQDTIETMEKERGLERALLYGSPLGVGEKGYSYINANGQPPGVDHQYL